MVDYNGMINGIISFIVVAAILILILRKVGKITQKKAKPVYALGLKGQGLIKEIYELEMVEDGSILKDGMTNKQVIIDTSPIKIITGKKEHQGYVCDMDKGVTVDLQKAGSMISVKTNPEMISNILDGRLIQDAFGIRPYRGMLLAVFLVALAMGFIFGLAF